MKTFSTKEVAPLFFAVFVDVFGFSIAFPTITEIFTSSMSPFFKELSSASGHTLLLAICYATYTFGMFFGSTFLGDLSDIIKRKRVLLIALAGLALCYLLMALAIQLTTLSLFMLARLLAGLLAGSFPTAMAAIIDLSTEQNKAWHMGIIAFSQSIGFVAGSVCGGVLADPSILPFFNLQLPFYLGAVISLGAYIWVYFAFAETFSLKANKSFSFKRSSLALWEGAKHPRVRTLSIAFFFMQAAITCLLTLIPLYLVKNYHASDALIGYFSGFLGVPFLLATLVALPLLAKYLKVETITLWTLFIAGIVMALLEIRAGLAYIWTIAFGIAFFHQIGFSAILTCYSNATDVKNQGWAMGVGISSLALSWTVSVFITLFIPIAGITPLLLVGTACYFIASATMLYYNKVIDKAGF